jgi:adenosylcobinamide-GDP ribazoletransferase
VLRRAFAFLTPIGGALPPSPGAVAWFPIVGATVGLAVGGVWWAAAHFWSRPIAATVAVVADLALTGLLHLDGLVDAADGLLPPLPRERRLDVMSDPAAGAFGIAAAISVLLLRLSALAAMAPSPLLLAALWCASRTVMAWTIAALPYARPGGLADAFVGPRSGTAAAGSLLAVAAGVAGRGPTGFVAVVAVLAGAGVVLAFAHRRIGGFTGDVLGAAGIIGETVGLLVAAGRW